MYEPHRARHLQVTDTRDRVFTMLGHFTVRMDNAELEGAAGRLRKDNPQVYNDVAMRAPTGDLTLITLATVQHLNLPPSTEASNQASGQIWAVDENTLPSWVPN
jgi:hypothetical protein